MSDDIATLKGWLPVDAVVLDQRPGLQWIDMQGVLLREPFFQQTVERVRRETPARAERFTELSAVIQLEQLLDSVHPSGFIFHSSRCGSTLIANACKSLAGSIVISEASAVDKLVARFATDTMPGDVKTKLYSVFLRGVVAALGQRRAGDERSLIVKFSCCSTFHFDLIKRIWPNVPAVFVYRDPIETIVSNLKNLPDWMRDEDRRVLAAITSTSPETISGMSEEELCARSLGSFYSSGLAIVNDGGLLLNYEQLSTEAILDLLKGFGIVPSDEEREAMQRETKIYSKDTSATLRFVGDSKAKRVQASELMKRMVARWSQGPYDELESRRISLMR